VARPTNTSIFLRNLREAGGRLSNAALLQLLDWSEEKYWTIHQELHDAGLIAKGRGKGGTVILVVPESSEDVAQSAAALSKPNVEAVAEELAKATDEAAERIEIREMDLYAPAVTVLKKHWTQEKQLLHGIFEITAQMGRKDTGGSWSRPDIVGVGFRKFEYLPDRLLEVYTFELKAEYDISIKGVLEALAHRERATRSYTVYHTGGRAWDDFPEAQRIEQLAARHGVGVIVAADIEDYGDGWEERVTASRSGSDPEEIDRFLKLTLSEEAKSHIRKWY